MAEFQENLTKETLKTLKVSLVLRPQIQLWTPKTE